MQTTRAKKSLGQNFLVDKNIAMKIITTANIQPEDHVLEIGPGRGALTDLIVDRCKKLTIIELDDQLVENLSKKYADNDKVTLIHGDAIKVDFKELDLEKNHRLNSRRFKLISNLPYNISGPMLAKIIDCRDIISDATLMLQKEVADRVTATNESKKSYGVLSVIIQNYADTFMEFTVPPTAFSPQPKVTSAIITISLLEGARYPTEDYKLFKRTVKSAFNLRRKTLLNSLKTMGCDAETIAQALNNAKIDPKRRGETLNIQEFTTLSNSFYGLTKEK